MLHVMFFCLGNICRSPLGEALFLHHVKQHNLSDQFVVQSSGTSAYHVGELPDPGSRAVAKAKLGLDLSDQRAQQLTPHHLHTMDVLVAMSHANISAAQRLPRSQDTNILLLRDFEPDIKHRDLDTPDPWGRGQEAFEEVFEIVNRCTRHLLIHLIEQHNIK